MIAIKKILCSLPALVAAIGPLSAQLYHPGERLEYRVSYKAKMFPQHGGRHRRRNDRACDRRRSHRL